MKNDSHSILSVSKVGYFVYVGSYGWEGEQQ